MGRQWLPANIQASKSIINHNALNRVSQDSPKDLLESKTEEKNGNKKILLALSLLGASVIGGLYFLKHKNINKVADEVMDNFSQILETKMSTHARSDYEQFDILKLSRLLEENPQNISDDVAKEVKTALTSLVERKNTQNISDEMHSSLENILLNKADNKTEIFEQVARFSKATDEQLRLAEFNIPFSKKSEPFFRLLKMNKAEYSSELLDVLSYGDPKYRSILSSLIDAGVPIIQKENNGLCLSQIKYAESIGAIPKSKAITARGQLERTRVVAQEQVDACERLQSLVPKEKVKEVYKDIPLFKNENGLSDSDLSLLSEHLEIIPRFSKADFDAFAESPAMFRMFIDTQKISQLTHHV